MQPITPELAAILKDHFQAGAQGFRARLEIGGAGAAAGRLSSTGALTEVGIDITGASTSLRWQGKLRASSGAAGPGTLTITLGPDGVPTGVLNLATRILTLREGATLALGAPETVEDNDVTWYDAGDGWSPTAAAWAPLTAMTAGKVVRPTIDDGNLWIWYPGGTLSGTDEPDFGSAAPGEYVPDGDGYLYNAGPALAIVTAWLAAHEFSNADGLFAGDSAILIQPGNGRTYVAELTGGELTGATSPFTTPVDLAAYFYLALEVDRGDGEIRAKAWPVGDAEPGWGVVESSAGGGVDEILLDLDATATTLLFKEHRVWADDVEQGSPFDSFSRGPLAGEWGTADHGETWVDDAFDEDIAVEGGGDATAFRVIRAAPSKSTSTDSDRLEVTIDNSTGEIEDGDILPNMPIRLWAWYGEEANAIQVFSGLIDRPRLQRHPSVVTISARDWMKKLIVQKLLLLGPQAADDETAIRTTDNYVYLGWEISAIVTDLLNRAGYPGDRRSITATGITVDEFLGADDEPFARAISRLADIPGFLSYADELGVYHFEPNDKTDPRDPDYTFRTGEDVLALALETDDEQAYSRVRVDGPMTVTSSTPAWEEVWETSAVGHPVGVWYDPADPDHVRVLDSRTKRVYRLLQADQSIVDSVYIGGSVAYPVGLSGDPDDADAYWILNAPCWDTGGPVNGIQSGNALHKFRKSDNVHLATYGLPNGAWSDMKVSAAFVWLTRYLTHELWKFDRTTVTPLTGYTLADPANGALLRNPTGVAVDGTTLDVFYAAGRSYLVDESAPTTVTSSIASSPGMYGGDYDVDTHTELFVVSSGQSRTWKYTIASITETSTEVYAEAIDPAFEALLESLSGSPEIRRLRVHLEAIVSVADAQAQAEAMLARVNHFDRTIDVGIIGNPALQKIDKVRFEDPVLGLAGDWQVGTYPSELDGDAGTYLGTLSMKPWEAP